MSAPRVKNLSTDLKDLHPITMEAKLFFKDIRSGSQEGLFNSFAEWTVDNKFTNNILNAMDKNKGRREHAEREFMVLMLHCPDVPQAKKQELIDNFRIHDENFFKRFIVPVLSRIDEMAKTPTLKADAVSESKFRR